MNKQELELIHGTTVMTQTELNARYKITSFLDPFCYATDKKTGGEVILRFQEVPRLYWVYDDRSMLR